MKTKKCVRDIQTAVDVYYQSDRVGNKDIMRLFDCGEGTARKLKSMAREQEAKDGRISPSTTTVNVVSAYKAWGIDIADMVRRLKQYQKLQKGAV